MDNIFLRKIINIIGIMFMAINLLANDIRIEEGYIKTLYSEIYYKKLFTEKNKDDIPLLALHGGPGLTHDSLDTLAELALEFPIIFYDQTGSGKSNNYDKTKVSWDVNFFLNDLENVISYFNLKNIYLLGFSWGGTLALEYALSPDNAVRKLILASPFLSAEIWTKDSFELLEKLGPQWKELALNHIQEGTTNDMEYQKMMTLFNRNYLYRLPEWTESMKYTVAHMNPEISETLFGTNDFIINGILKSYDRFQEVKTIKVPLLMTCGQYDWARPDTLAQSIKGMSNGKLFILEKVLTWHTLKKKSFIWKK